MNIPTRPETVVLYLYDLSQGMAAQFSPMLLGKTIEGIWHTGVVVFGREYYYGGGIQWANPGDTIAGSPLRRIDLGIARVSQAELHAFLAEISHRFTPDTYSLLHHNCNNFSNELSLFLTGQPIPDYITGLPQEALSTPIGAMLIPMIEQFENQMRNSGGGLVPWEENSSPSRRSAFSPGNTRHVPAVVHRANARGSEAVSTKPKAKEPVQIPKIPQLREDPHANLKLKCISAKSVPLMSVDKNAALFHKQMKGSLTNTEEERTISELVDTLVSDSEDRDPSTACVSVFNRLIQDSGPKALFPVLALLRLAVVQKSIALNLLFEDKNNRFIHQMLHRTIGTEDDASEAPSPMSVQIMSLCVLSNLISHLGHAHDLAMTSWVASSVLRALRSPKASVRMMGATVAYNCSLHLRFDSLDSSDRDDVAIQYISALAEILPQESDAPTRYRGLLALGHLVYFMGAEGAMLLQALGFEEATYRTPEKNASIASDIDVLLQRCM